MGLLHLEELSVFTERPYYPRKLVPANARGQGRREDRVQGPTTHPHSRIKHKCHLPMLDPHEPRASLDPSTHSFVAADPFPALVARSVTFRSSSLPRPSLLVAIPAKKQSCNATDSRRPASLPYPLNLSTHARVGLKQTQRGRLKCSQKSQKSIEGQLK